MIPHDHNFCSFMAYVSERTCFCIKDSCFLFFQLAFHYITWDLTVIILTVNLLLYGGSFKGLFNFTDPQPMDYHDGLPYRLPKRAT